jgi:predicted nucleic acid-binding protein
LKYFFDSSVLVPVLYADHKHHAPSVKVFLAARKDGFCALHTLGKVYSALTNLPANPRITGANALAMVKQLPDRLSVVSLNEQEYVSALETAASHNVTGGTTYDALIAQCALKVAADVLFTWNVRHFVMLGSAIQRLVKTPLELSVT